jgi:hypothetical protein
VMVAHGPAFDDSQVEPEAEPELVGAAARPKFAEMEQDSKYTPLPRDFAPGQGNGAHPQDTIPQPAAALFTEPGQDSERDLDVPAFMRRLQF